MLLRQPQHGPLRIDWANPITKGLALSMLPSNGFVDVVTGEQYIPFGTAPVISTGAFGKCLDSTTDWGGIKISPARNICTVEQTHILLVEFVQRNYSYAGMLTSATADGSSYSFSLQDNGANVFSVYPTGTTLPSDIPFGPSMIVVSGDASGCIAYKDGEIILASGPAPIVQSNSRFVLFGERVANANYSTKGRIYFHASFTRRLSVAEIKSITRNPWQIYADHSDVEVLKSSAGGGLSLTGSLTGQGSTLSASATNTEVHAISGTLVGAGATLSGTATRIYSLSGALTGQGATLSGSATTLESHAATGALVGSGSTLSATATNTEIHTATGTLVGAGSTLSGATTNTPLGINASGSLVGQGATLAATATNTEVHTCTGALYGQGATLSGALTRVFSASGSLVGAGSTLSATAGNAVAVFSATGSLVGQGSTLAGSATNTETHAVSGSLTGQGASLSATAALANLHTLSGSLVGSGSSLVGYASGPTTAFDAPPDSIVTVINKRNRVSVISRRS